METARTACTWWVLSVFLVPCDRLRLCHLQLGGIMAPIKWVDVLVMLPLECQAVDHGGSGMKTTPCALSLMSGTT